MEDERTELQEQDISQQQEQDFFDEYRIEGVDVEDAAPQKSGFLSVVLSDKYYIPGVRILMGLILAVCSLMKNVPSVVSMAMAFASVILCGFDLLRRSFEDIKQGNILSENTILSMAAIAGTAVSAHLSALVLLLCAEAVYTVRSFMLAIIDDGIEKEIDDTASQPLRNMLDGALKNENPSIPWLGVASRYFMPGMLLGAVVFGLIYGFAAKSGIAAAVKQALVFLVLAYPCAAILVEPMGRKCGLVQLSKLGYYFKNFSAVMTAKKLTSLIFDKFGTVTEAQYTVSRVVPNKISAESLLFLATYAEAYSDHPLADCIRAYSGIQADKARIVRSKQDAGVGCIVQLDSSEIITIGSYELMQRLEVTGYYEPVPKTAVYIAVGRHYAGRIEFDCKIKDNAPLAVDRLRKMGVVNIALITGDNTLNATSIGKKLEITEIYADCEPKDKTERLSYIAANKDKGDTIGYLFCGKKPMPVIDGADIDISLGIPAGPMTAETIVCSDDPESLCEMIASAKRVGDLTALSLLVSFGVKLLALVSCLVFSLPFCAAYIVDSLIILAEIYILGRILK